VPGLVGVIDTGRDRRGHAPLLRRMCASVVHRPWYRVDGHVDAAAGLALARVHLGLLDAGPQPYVSDDRRLTVFLDGEVYDEAAAGRPLEWVAALYRRHGRDFAARMNGSFVAIVRDAAADRVLIATDRTGSRPLFYRQSGPVLYVAPELKALLVVPGLDSRLDWRAVAGFLGSGFWPNGYTPIDGVRRLDHATTLTVGGGTLQPHRYWDYRFAPDAPDRGERHYRGALAELVRVAVRRQVRSPHRYGVLLSGGYDSRGLLGCYLAERPGTTPITISWGVDEHTPGSDCWVARRLASRLGTKHRFFPLRAEALADHLDDTVYLGDGLTAACGNYPEGLDIFAAIREELGVQVLLRGDECFGWHAGAFDEATALQSVGIRALDDLPAYRTLLRPEAYHRLAALGADLLAEVSSRCSAASIHDRKDFFYLDQRLQHYLHPLNYLKTLEVEVRRPYLDNDVLDFVATLPARYRLDKALFRRTIVRMLPGLFRETARDGNLVDWQDRLATDTRLQRLVQQRLGTPAGILGPLLASVPAVRPRRPAPAWRGGLDAVVRGVKRHPWLYESLRKVVHGRRRAATTGAVTPAIVFRLLTLASWADLFLETPGGCERAAAGGGVSAP
jgi:asparagine synthetase B (glutamine-hydrolysing)